MAKSSKTLSERVSRVEKASTLAFMSKETRDDLREFLEWLDDVLCAVEEELKNERLPRQD